MQDKTRKQLTSQFAQSSHPSPRIPNAETTPQDTLPRYRQDRGAVFCWIVLFLFGPKAATPGPCEVEEMFPLCAAERRRGYSQCGQVQRPLPRGIETQHGDDLDAR